MNAITSAIRVEQIGNATLYLGDCREIMASIEQFDAVVTDPPYGIGEDGGKYRGSPGHRGARILPKAGWDKAPPDKACFQLMLSKASDHIIWGGNYFSDRLPVSRGWLYWDKRMGGDFSDGELAYTSLDKPLKAFSLCNKMAGKEHPTQKPDALLMWCLGFIPNAHSILDPFMGSGTTGVACARLGLRFTGIEVHEPYFRIACRRISAAQRQVELFSPTDRPDPSFMRTDDLFSGEGI